MTTTRNTRLLLASAVLGLVAASNAGAAAAAEKAESEKVHCYGINACKGTGDCSGKGHPCAGQNACKGQGHINLPKELCLRIQGGHLVAGPGEEG
ncbi:MAG TPA: hypothetical protein VEC57_06375 [Candidatus Limnocylindrales bacterium]|nr:hypothetical protein [Candidatus Limnocylindrales bacterium]